MRCSRGLVVGVVVIGIGCSAPGGQAVGRISQPALTENALTENALTENALTENALTENALTENALTENALTGNALTAAALQDPNARLLLKYLIRVAFRPDQCETFGWADPQTGTNPAVYCGALALCPQWRDHGIQGDVPCQEWVTAGLLAHVNAFGVKVPFSARAPAAPLLVVSEYEALAFEYREGAFWGNFFRHPRELHAATDVRNVEVALLNDRVCSLSDSSCGIDVIGPVDSAAVSGNLARGWACEVTSTSLTWVHPLQDPAFFFDVEPEDVENLHPTGDQLASDCHPYLTNLTYVPSDEEIARRSLRVVTTYLTEAAVRMLYGCSSTMAPEPDGVCADASVCSHPGDPCCQTSGGSRYCNDWQVSATRTRPLQCVNDDVAVGSQSQYSCSATF